MRVRIEIQEHKKCIAFAIVKKAGDIYMFELCKVESGYRRKGFGQELYRLASMMVGEGVYSDIPANRTEQANLWHEGMADKGVMRRVGEGRYRYFMQSDYLDSKFNESEDSIDG